MQPIIHEVVYPHPVERVWRALTDRAAIAAWLMPNDFAPVVGREFEFWTKSKPGWEGTVRGAVTEVVEHRRLAYSWKGASPAMGAPTLVTWTLEPTAGGTRLRLEHAGFTGLGGFLVRSILARGWRRKIMRESLPRVLRELEAEEDRGAESGGRS